LPKVFVVIVDDDPSSSEINVPMEPTRHCSDPDEPVDGHIPDEKGFIQEVPQLQRLLLHARTLLYSCF
jgi:hypothetical protein